MAWRAGFQFVSIACCGSRNHETGKRYEEREIGEMQGLLEHDDPDREMGSLDGSRAQDLLLQVEASENRGLQIEEEGQNADGLQDDGAARDNDTSLGDGGSLDAEEVHSDTIARDDELVQGDETVRHDGSGQGEEGLHDNTNGSQDYAVSDRGSIEVEDSVQSAPASQDYAAVHPIESHVVEHEGPITPPATIIPRDLPPNDRTEDTTSRIVDPVNTSSIRNLNLLSVLTESKEICDRIMSLLFPGDSIDICECIEGAEGATISQLHGKLGYWPIDTTSFQYQRLLRETPCSASQQLEALDLARIDRRSAEKDKPFSGFNLNVLLVRKAFHELSLKYFLSLRYLWARNFHFQCSAKATRDFLMDPHHAPHVRSMTQIDLFYRYTNELGVIETSDYEWHDMMNKVRHHFSCIPKIHIHVGHGFWDRTDWKVDVGTVMNQREHRHPIFLDDVEKTAAPAERWQDHDNSATRRTDGTLIQVSIEHTGEETAYEKM